jgi:hypothetical protein
VAEIETVWAANNQLNKLVGPAGLLDVVLSKGAVVVVLSKGRSFIDLPSA